MHVLQHNLDKHLELDYPMHVLQRHLDNLSGTPCNTPRPLTSITGHSVSIQRVSPFLRLRCGFRSQANLNPLIYLYFTVKSHYK